VKADVLVCVLWAAAETTEEAAAEDEAAAGAAVPAADANKGTSAPLVASLAQRVCAGSCC